MILSYTQIEEIAAAVTKDFNEFFFGERAAPETHYAQATPIDWLATDYLGLRVSYARLSEDGSICGLTAYTDTEYAATYRGVTHVIPLRANEVLLDSSFMEPGQVRSRCGKRRFTLAHECAHQLLFQMESDEARRACEEAYSPRTAYSLRDLKTREDWNEWQANALGAAILMPQREIDRAMDYLARGRKLIDYEGWFGYMDLMVLKQLCQTLGVSRSAAVIRLRQLGYMEERPYAEYIDPLEVWA